VSRIRRVGLALALLLLVAVAAVSWSGLRSLDAPLRVTAPTRFKVASGASFAHVATELATQGIIAQPRVWILYARWKRLAPAVKAGEYEIQPGTTARELLTKMVNGQVLLHSFTIVDGWRVQDLLDALGRNPDIVSTSPQQTTLSERTANIMAKLGAPGTDAEGQFLPETYRFISGTTDIELLRQAHAALVRELDAAWMDRDPDLPLHSANELLIMASIVQKESGLPQELGKIAGLYLHRVQLGMRLQADPTVIYGLGEHYDGDIHTVRRKPTPSTSLPRPKVTAATSFPQPSSSTIPRSQPTWRISARRRRNQCDECGRALHHDGGDRRGGQDHAGGALVRSAGETGHRACRDP
jgi:UPF0755 protein